MKKFEKEWLMLSPQLNVTLRKKLFCGAKNVVAELKNQEIMLVKDKIKQAVMVAMKDHDQKKVDALRFLISLIDKKEYQLPPGGMTDAEEVNVLRKELKNKEESREMFVKASRTDLVDQLDYEISLVKEYLPLEMTEEELKEIVDEVLRQAQDGANFGMVMGQVMKMVAGRAGGEVVTRIVKEKMTND